MLQGRPEWLQRVTAAWQAGALTNFDYILCINLAAGRSFNDLTQVDMAAASVPCTSAHEQSRASS